MPSPFDSSSVPVDPIATATSTFNDASSRSLLHQKLDDYLDVVEAHGGRGTLTFLLFDGRVECEVHINEQLGG